MPRWNDPEPVLFCEGRWSSAARPGSAAYEAINALSSAAFVLIGVQGGARTGVDCWTRLLYAILTVCGVGSVLFHAHFIVAFRFWDEFALALLVTLGSFVTWCDFVQRTRPEMQPAARSRRLFAGAVASTLAFVGIVEVDVFAKSLSLYATLVGSCLFTIFFFAESARHTMGATERHLLRRAEIAGGAAALAWSVDLFLCSLPVSYLFLHGWWHLLIAVTANHLIELHHLVAFEPGGAPARCTIRHWSVFRLVDVQRTSVRRPKDGGGQRSTSSRSQIEHSIAEEHASSSGQVQLLEFLT